MKYNPDFKDLKAPDFGYLDFKDPERLKSIISELVGSREQGAVK